MSFFIVFASIAFTNSSVFAESDNRDEIPNSSITNGRQLGLPSFPSSFFSSRIPCSCNSGVCKCCTGSILFATKGCAEIVYYPEKFAFELRMKLNDFVLYKTQISGKNPPPICVRAPQYGFVKVCTTFYDVYFIGRNMHICMDFGTYFQGYELFSRSFDCLMLGDKGVKLVKPEVGYPLRPNEATVDQGDDGDLEDYDENLVRKLDTSDKPQVLTN